MRRDTIQIIVIAAAGQAVSYALAVLLARRLGIDGFEAYVVASAVLIVMVALAPCGLDKYAVRAIPALLTRRDWNRVRGYIRFGIRRTLLVSLAMALASMAALHWWRAAPVDEIQVAILVAVIALPA